VYNYFKNVLGLSMVKYIEKYLALEISFQKIEKSQSTPETFFIKKKLISLGIPFYYANEINADF